MVNLLLIFAFLTNWTPVLHEGRYQPHGALTEDVGTPIDQETYAKLEGKPYKEAHGKALRYPTKTQLKTELLLRTLPLKWILIALYLLALFLPRLLLIPFSLHTALLALTCYVLKRPPVSNMAETLIYVPWIAVLTSLLFKRPREGALIAAILLFFIPTHLPFETVRAVLDSQYWLIVHVLMVVGSYGIFFFAGVLGHIYLVKRNTTIEKTLLKALYLGTALLIGGTILGGVWAAQSWGRFWDWDPKESWAFISSGLYLIVIHAYRFKKIGAKGLAIGSIVGLLAITFTWYGVNYILQAGLHSYGFGSGGGWFYALFIGLEGLFLGIFGKKIEKKGPSE